MSETAKVTLRTIANKADVSVATVSTVLSNKAGAGKVRISDQTIQKVRRIARAMGYNRQVVIGLITTWFREATEIPIVHSIIEKLREEDIHLAMGLTTHAELNAEFDELDLLDKEGFDGVIMEPSFALLQQIAAQRVSEMGASPGDATSLAACKNLVFINRYPIDGIPCITVDHRQCGVIAARHLIDKGHRRIAFLEGHFEAEPASYRPPIEKRVVLDRYQGFVEALAEADLKAVLVRDVQEVLALRSEITAVYCAHTRGSTALLNACWQAGVQIPQQLSIVGQDDEFAKEMARPALTTVDVRAREVGLLAARTVMACIDGEKPKGTVLAPRLIERESVHLL